MTIVARALQLLVIASALGAQSQRPMTFLDAQNMRQVSGQDISPNGRMMLYALSTPDWNQARRQSDIYLVNVDQGLSSTRQLTFTKDKNETSGAAAGAPAAGGGGGGRGGAGGGGARNQLFVLRLDGGEAKRVTDAREGVSSFQFTKDGKQVVYT